MVKDGFKMLDQNEQRKLVKGQFQSGGLWSYFSRALAVVSSQLSSWRS